MRNMSFAMTTEQIKNGTKSVTRRFGWKFLKVGDLVRPVLKGMGLKKGEKIQPLRGPLRITHVGRMPLNNISVADVEREGFPGWTPLQFIDMLVKHYGCKRDDRVTRIGFEYTNENPKSGEAE